MYQIFKLLKRFYIFFWFFSVFFTKGIVQKDSLYLKKVD